MTATGRAEQRATQHSSVGQSRGRFARRRVPTLLLVAWGALLLNVLTPAGSSDIIPLPRSMLQLVAQGALFVALILALALNPRVVVRPNLFLLLLSLMAVVALVVSIHSEFMVGSTYRALRLLGFVACLWLLTPWWGRDDMVLLRAHRLVLWAALASVVLGAALAPGAAYASGRLVGVLWPTPANQVAHYAAVLLGTTIILWLCRVITGRSALVGTAVTFAILLGTHVRTALLGAIVGLVLASASLFLGYARVRRATAKSVLAALVGAALFAPQIVKWAARGQSAEEATQLTGRTAVWAAATSEPRPFINDVFGNGLGNKSVGGLAIDGNWVASYLEIGWFGVAVQTAFLMLLLIMAVTHVRGPRRATAIYLIGYCIVASITEVGLGDASPYLLDLVVAASLLVLPTQPRAERVPRGARNPAREVSDGTQG